MGVVGRRRRLRLLLLLLPPTPVPFSCRLRHSSPPLELPPAAIRHSVRLCSPPSPPLNRCPSARRSPNHRLRRTTGEKQEEEEEEASGAEAIRHRRWRRVVMMRGAMPSGRSMEGREAPAVRCRRRSRRRRLPPPPPSPASPPPRAPSPCPLRRCRLRGREWGALKRRSRSIRAAPRRRRRRTKAAADCGGGGGGGHSKAAPPLRPIIDLPRAGGRTPSLLRPPFLPCPSSPFSGRLRSSPRLFP